MNFFFLYNESLFVIAYPFQYIFPKIEAEKNEDCMKISTEENEIVEHSSCGLHTNKQPTEEGEKKKKTIY